MCGGTGALFNWQKGMDGGIKRHLALTHTHKHTQWQRGGPAETEGKARQQCLHKHKRDGRADWVDRDGPNAAALVQKARQGSLAAELCSLGGEERRGMEGNGGCRRSIGVVDGMRWQGMDFHQSCTLVLAGYQCRTQDRLRRFVSLRCIVIASLQRKGMRRPGQARAATCSSKSCCAALRHSGVRWWYTGDLKRSYASMGDGRRAARAVTQPPSAAKRPTSTSLKKLL